MEVFGIAFLVLLLFGALVAPPLLAVGALFVGIGATPVRRRDSRVPGALALGLVLWSSRNGAVPHGV